jgi:hypothetical protein
MASFERSSARTDVQLAGACTQKEQVVSFINRVFMASMQPHNVLGRRCLVVPTADQPSSMLASSFWRSVDPKSFLYGDGAFGLEREVRLTLEEWIRYLLERGGLEYVSSVYDLDIEGPVAPTCLVAAAVVKRFAYIKSARLFADRGQCQEKLFDVCRLSADEMLEVMEKCGRGASPIEILGNDGVPERVKRFLCNSSLTMNNGPGTNAHRNMLRHIAFGYRLLRGPPLVFTTLNVADTKHVLIKRIMYEGQAVAAWRL